MNPNQKISTKDRLKEITAQIEIGIRELFESDRYQDYLRTMSRFHNYSLNNTMLIFMQRPDATLVAGFNKWHDQFHRTVNKGEKAIRILAPTPYKKKIEQAKLDPDTKLPLLDQDGKVITEEKEIKIPMFKPVPVFDVSQTSGEPLPSIVSELNGNVKNYEIFMEALRRSSPVPIEIKEIREAADGFFNFEDQAITLRSGMSEVQTICAAIHEIAHAKLHNPQNPVSEEEKSRRTQEVEAESIAYTVCQYFEIDTTENSFGYIATWSKNKEVKELRASLETINKTSSELITDVEHHLKTLLKERENEITETKPDVLYLVDDIHYLHIQKIDGGFDYSLYDVNTKKLIDGGCFEWSEIEELPIQNPIAAVRTLIFESEGLAPTKVEPADLQILEELHQINTQLINRRTTEMQFENSPDDTFCIYQLNANAPVELRFTSFDQLKESPMREHYDAVYTDVLLQSGTTTEKLEQLYTIFNVDHPADFKGHSLSVSDIVALKQNDVITYHYCDSIGFKQLSDFNHMKTAEELIEDDYNMIDGSINNGKRETDNAKPSVRSMLKTLQNNTQERKPVKKNERKFEHDPL